MNAQMNAPLTSTRDQNCAECGVAFKSPSQAMHSRSRLICRDVQACVNRTIDAPKARTAPPFGVCEDCQREFEDRYQLTHVKGRRICANTYACVKRMFAIADARAAAAGSLPPRRGRPPVAKTYAQGGQL
jgi:hypothetical protein